LIFFFDPFLTYAARQFEGAGKTQKKPAFVRLDRELAIPDSSMYEAQAIRGCRGTPQSWQPRGLKVTELADNETVACFG